MSVHHAELPRALERLRRLNGGPGLDPRWRGRGIVPPIGPSLVPGEQEGAQARVAASGGPPGQSGGRADFWKGRAWDLELLQRLAPHSCGACWLLASPSSHRGGDSAGGSSRCGSRRLLPSSEDKAGPARSSNPTIARQPGVSKHKRRGSIILNPPLVYEYGYEYGYEFEHLYFTRTPYGVRIHAQGRMTGCAIALQNRQHILARRWMPSPHRGWRVHASKGIGAGSSWHGCQEPECRKMGGRKSNRRISQGKALEGFSAGLPAWFYPSIIHE